MWNICTKDGQPTILIAVNDPIPDGYTVQAETANPDYLLNMSNSGVTKITNLAFRNRFTLTEKITIEIASLDSPTATSQQRQMAAMLRVYMRDIDNATYIDLSRADTQAGVRQLETYGIIGPGRADEILLAPPAPVEFLSLVLA